MRAVLLTFCVLALGACESSGKLMTLASDDGPEEFAIVPSKPLELPPDLAALPAPTPGGSNITDQNPDADAVAALGGNPAQLAAQGVGAGDGALIAHAGRHGVTPGVRQITAQEDAEYRRRNGRRLLEVVARSNVYYRAYRRQSLDSQAELDRWRPTGVQTPTAPPAPSR
ncbi:DUF3035 domain-containing protein [Paracoccus sphaerophysae]|uniref:Pyruvate/2-oxoglutarate dehydrogenase complex, dihydrolipoamide acyltransferase (E2) component n=1 Tax=Paracoccus sphaerophysae TaxID=690417 RepID=A0A099FGT9_9RHOB|nr:DUF3035 domain-containing protein [Paracoccus sphaerophysae]KGJ09398.1 pyruvate/2-oxoglutarate dehydrogenase complex, dihydrolipoamide acyltransferase (E2) component [Paracoccus sphaerophysae]